MPDQSDLWKEKLKDVDFERSRDEITYMLKIAKEDAEKRGGEYYVKKEFHDVLTLFMSKPCLKNAIKLLECSPATYPYFERSKPSWATPVIKQEKIDFIILLVGETTSTALGCLSESEEFKNLDLEITSKVVLELILFLLQLCDREIFYLLGSEKRAIIMDRVLEGLSKCLEQYDEQILISSFGEQTDANLNKYFEYLAKTALSADFRGSYNERQSQYGVYKKLFADKGESPKNTLVWEFSKKVAILTKVTPEVLIKLITLSSGMVLTFNKNLKFNFEIE